MNKEQVDTLKKKSDAELWLWALEHKHECKVVLDNDMTVLVVEYDNGIAEIRFSDYIGNESGLYELFHGLGIQAESV